VLDAARIFVCVGWSITGSLNLPLERLNSRVIFLFFFSVQEKTSGFALPETRSLTHLKLDLGGQQKDVILDFDRVQVLEFFGYLVANLPSFAVCNDQASI
jgi:hypothetical protein